MSKNYYAELDLSVISINHGGRSDIDNHLETTKQKSSVEAAMSSSRVTHLFKADHSDESPLLAAKEATFVYYDDIYGHFYTFRISVCNL